MGGLCALSDVKSWLDISTTQKDAKLQLFIDTVSEQMITYLGYQARRTTYTSEPHTINNNQLLYLNGAPIQSVSSVIIDGVTIVAGSNDENYQFDDTDAKAGRIYIGTGFSGRYFTRGMTYDPVAGARVVNVSYVAGWYFPDDVGYVISDAKSYNASASLPYAISSACIQEVVVKYRRNVARAEGVTSYREGGIAWSWENSSKKNPQAMNDHGGLSEDTCAVLNAYRRWGFA